MERYEVKGQVDGYWVGDSEVRKLVAGPWYRRETAQGAADRWNRGEQVTPLDTMLGR